MTARELPQPIRIATYAYERSVMVTCGQCPHTVEATLRFAALVPDALCDQRLTRDLRTEGWRVDDSGETCPDCVKAGR